MTELPENIRECPSCGAHYCLECNEDCDCVTTSDSVPSSSEHHPWTIDISGDRAEGMEALVDFEDYSELRQHTWFLTEGGYAFRHEEDGNGTVRMHREIMGLGKDDDQIVDHINGERLDNRKDNLRILANVGANNQNVASRRGSSKYRGVYFDEDRDKWVAMGHKQVDGESKSVFVGRYETEEAAHEAIVEWREENLEYSVERE